MPARILQLLPCLQLSYSLLCPPMTRIALPITLRSRMHRKASGALSSGKRCEICTWWVERWRGMGRGMQTLQRPIKKQIPLHLHFECVFRQPLHHVLHALQQDLRPVLQVRAPKYPMHRHVLDEKQVDGHLGGRVGLGWVRSTWARCVKRGEESCLSTPPQTKRQPPCCEDRCQGPQEGMTYPCPSFPTLTRTLGICPAANPMTR
jgi:hypothetical protein